MAGRENETVAVQPPWGLGIEGQSVAEQIGPDFGGSQGKSKVSGAASVNGVDGQTAGLGCGCRENIVVYGHNFAWFKTLKKAKDGQRGNLSFPRGDEIETKGRWRSVGDPS